MPHPTHRLLAALVLTLPCALARAQDAPPHLHDDNHPHELGEVLTVGRAEGLVGMADTASEGRVTRERMDLLPLARSADMFEMVPGMGSLRHAGGGDAGNLFLRGFTLGHGSDFATSLNGVPLNQPSHAHFHGFTNLQIIIPELVDGIDFQKGPYKAQVGNFGSVGSADFQYGQQLKFGFATASFGSWGYNRQAIGAPIDMGESGRLIVGLERTHDNGPWKNEDDFQKFNGVLTYAKGDATHGFSITGMGHHGKWNSTSQVPQRAIAQGLIGRFGTLDPTDGGESQRYGLSGEFHHLEDGHEFKASAYAIHASQIMFFNFTQFTEDEVNGDQREQNDKRYQFGGQASYGFAQDAGNIHLHHEFGVQLRNDRIDNGTYASAARTRLGAPSRKDNTWESSLGAHYDNVTFWSDTFRTTAGVRADLFHFDVDSQTAGNSGTETAGIVSPKLGLVVGPFARTEFYANAGMGFHSNAAQGVLTTRDEMGAPVDPADALVRQWGAEVGVRTEAIKGLQSAVALWVMESDSELTYVGEDGVVEPGRAGRRFGVEFTNDVKLTDWLSLNGDLSLARARFTDFDPAGDRIPNAISTMGNLGLMVRFKEGFFGSIGTRYIGATPLLEDDSMRSKPIFTVNLMAGYQINSRWKITGEVFNLLNRRNNDIHLAYESRLAGEPSGVSTLDSVVHPAEPISGRISITGMF